MIQSKFDPKRYSLTVNSCHIGRYCLLLTIAIFPSLAGFNQMSSDRNFVSKTDIKQPNVTTQAQVDGLPANGKLQNVNYLDGLGRPLQLVTVQGAPNNKDIITPIEIDGYGREIKKFLPYTDVSGTSFGNFRPGAYADQKNFYSPANNSVPDVARDEHPYAQTSFEFSPLNRPIETGAPGKTWQPGSGHTLKTVFSINGANDDVKRFTIAYSTAATPFVAGAYSAGELYKNITIDEQGKQIIEYKDKEGKILLKKVQLSDNPGESYTGWLSTYYILSLIHI